MFNNRHPKCANPACAMPFHWLSGGKFFRFHRGPAQAIPTGGGAGRVENVRQVEHFWLCERCSNIYTLGYESGRGVMLRLQWSEVTEGESILQLPAA
jgi:hypothetical protein